MKRKVRDGVYSRGLGYTRFIAHIALYFAV
jgi:hypothetical protein